MNFHKQQLILSVATEGLEGSWHSNRKSDLNTKGREGGKERRQYKEMAKMS